MMVSPDGIIECNHDYCFRSCEATSEFAHISRVVEIKSVYNQEEMVHRYKIPFYHACQLLAEMNVTNTREAW